MEKDTSGNLYFCELNTIIKFSAMINSSLKIESVLNSAMKCAEEFINAEASTIYEIDIENNELFIRLARGEKKDFIEKVRIKIGEGIAGKVVQTGSAMVINDISNEPLFSDKYDRQTGFKTRSLICVPLVTRGDVIGALQVLNKKSKEHFSDADLELLTALSHQVAIAMDNASLYERLEHKFELTALELKAAQEKLIRSERLAAMGHLIDGVAHEIRNPVMVIGGFARRIRETTQKDENLSHYADIIVDESERLEMLVQKVKELADIQTASLNPGDIMEVMNKVIKSFLPEATKRGIDISLNKEKDLPLINMDSSQMVTAISNVIENSIDAINENGKIFVSVKNEDNFILIEIKDTGPGIIEEDINSIYDPFVTSKTRGAGLGLTMTHQIMLNHEGEINISSSRGCGATAAIRLPVKNKTNV